MLVDPRFGHQECRSERVGLALILIAAFEGLINGDGSVMVMPEEKVAELVSKGEEGARRPVRRIHDYQREASVANRRPGQRVVLKPLDKDVYPQLVLYG